MTYNRAHEMGLPVGIRLASGCLQHDGIAVAGPLRRGEGKVTEVREFCAAPGLAPEDEEVAPQHIEPRPEEDAIIALAAGEQAALQAQKLRIAVSGDDAIQATVGEGGPLPGVVVAPVGIELARERVPTGVGVVVLPHRALAPVEFHHGGHPHIQSRCRYRRPHRILLVPVVPIVLPHGRELLGRDIHGEGQLLGLRVLHRRRDSGLVGATLPLLARWRWRSDSVRLDDALKEEAEFAFVHERPVRELHLRAPVLWLGILASAHPEEAGVG